ncbi:hypothetical protein SAMN02799630_02205 [Paenibacillus sp. UNCCL117]|nr:hypothetical protein SAMN04488602_10681 [Paenibacillus sp. cl123]SFW34038.1 hypothetical protein SAMN02799630_02205 [Paenibacillus sp. UNCCL117]
MSLNWASLSQPRVEPHPEELSLKPFFYGQRAAPSPCMMKKGQARTYPVLGLFGL